MIYYYYLLLILLFIIYVCIIDYLCIIRLYYLIFITKSIQYKYIGINILKLYIDNILYYITIYYYIMEGFII